MLDQLVTCSILQRLAIYDSSCVLFCNDILRISQKSQNAHVLSENSECTLKVPAIC